MLFIVSVKVDVMLDKYTTISMPTVANNNKHMIIMNMLA